MGPLDSLLRDLTRWWGSPERGPRMGTTIHCTHAHTHIFVEPYIIHLIYRKYMYLYYTQAVTLREGPDTQTRTWAPGTGSVTSRRSAGRRLDQPILLPPFVLLRESKGVLGQGWGAPMSNKWGLLVTGGKPGTPKVFEDQDSPGKVGGGNKCLSLGN